MTDARDALAEMLAATEAKEMDCDAFLSHVAEYAENRNVGDLTALFEHHRAICPECEEELQYLIRALGAG